MAEYIICGLCETPNPIECVSCVQCNELLDQSIASFDTIECPHCKAKNPCECVNCVQCDEPLSPIENETADLSGSSDPSENSDDDDSTNPNYLKKAKLPESLKGCSKCKQICPFASRSCQSCGTMFPPVERELLAILQTGPTSFSEDELLAAIKHVNASARIDLIAAIEWATQQSIAIIPASLSAALAALEKLAPKSTTPASSADTTATDITSLSSTASASAACAPPAESVFQCVVVDGPPAASLSLQLKYNGKHVKVTAATWGQLQAHVLDSTCVSVALQRLAFGFPPKDLAVDTAATTSLTSLGLSNMDTVLVKTSVGQAVASASTVINASAATSSSLLASVVAAKLAKPKASGGGIHTLSSVKKASSGSGGGLGGGFGGDLASLGGGLGSLMNSIGVGSGGSAKSTGYDNIRYEELRVDPETLAAIQRSRDARATHYLRALAVLLPADEAVDGMVEQLQSSCLLSVLVEYLSNDSSLEIESRAALFDATLALVERLAHVPSAPMLFAAPVSAPSSSAASRSLDAQLTRFSAVVCGLASPQDHDDALDVPAPDQPVLARVHSTMTSLARACAAAMAAVATHVTTHLHIPVAADEEKSPLPAMSETYASSMLACDSVATVPGFNGYHYAAVSDGESTERNKRLKREIRSLTNSLPETIFLRFQENDMSICRMLIISPDKTPYGLGAFLFDVKFPSTYPNSPSMVNLTTTGNGTVRFNPNLYECGKVCLSLVEGWPAQRPEEAWNPSVSTFWQVAISIQSMMFGVEHPYCNEPAFYNALETAAGRRESEHYNQNIRLRTVQWAMIDMLKNPPVHFEPIVRTHFRLKRDVILKQLTLWVLLAQGPFKAPMTEARDTLTALLQSL